MSPSQSSVAAAMTTVAGATVSSRGRSRASVGGPSIALLTAIALIQADAFIHILAIREHFAEWWGYGSFFVAATVVQIAFSLLLAWRPSRSLAVAGIAGSLFLVGLYALSRTAGIPLFGPHAGHVEEIGGLDILSKAIEVALLVPLAAVAGSAKASVRPLVADPVALAGAASNAAVPPAPARKIQRARRSILTLAGGVAVAVALLVVGYRFGTGLQLGPSGGTVSASDSASCAGRSCDIHFTATLAAKAYAERLGIWNEVEPRLASSEAFVVTATAHAGEVAELSMDDRVFLRQDRTTYPAAGRPLAVTTHHNTYLFFFPKFDMSGRPLLDREEGGFEILVVDPDGAGQRVLPFSYPLVKADGRVLPLPQILVTLGAAMAALLFACTPCLVGSLAVGSMTTGAAVSYDREAVRAHVRQRIIKQTLVYLGAVIAAYLAVAIAVSVFRLETRALRPVEFTGGLALGAVGLSLLRAWRPFGAAMHAVGEGVRRLLPTRRPASGREVRFNDSSASAMGASLAMVCSVAGAPTLSTAILLPILVYAGLSNPLWAITLLGVYLLVCAVPFFFVAVGWGEFLMNASMRWRTSVLIGSGIVLIALGLLLVVSPSTLANMISAPARIALTPFRWLG